MQVDMQKLDSIPKNTYMHVENDIDNEDHIIKNRPSTGARITADKLIKDVFDYAPKGMKGSKNSNFYEFLSLGLIPNVIGSAMLMIISNAVNSTPGGIKSVFAKENGKKMAAGVLLYSAGKWVGEKLITKGVKAKTGVVDLDKNYKKIVHELPDYKGDTDTTSVEFHKVFESVDFPRWDLINKEGEHNNNRFEYYNKAAEKMGYKKQLNAPDQTVQPAIKEVAVKSKAAQNISKYIWAALGVAIAQQDAVGKFMQFPSVNTTLKDKIKLLPGEIARTSKEAFKSLISSKTGKGLVIAAAVSSVLGIWNATRNFKASKEEKTSTVDFSKSYTEN